ncbi:transposable element Tc1 transposase [Trichonephila clavipes]|nr:transposable element Tc1 transposase [Trichonephila clavipes]
MAGKRARRHFSQLSEFERALIIGMKTAGWSMRRVAGLVDRSECAVRNCWEQWARESTHVPKTGDSFNDTLDVGVEIVPQTISRHLAEANLKSKRPFRALPLTLEHRQLRLQWCQARSMWNVTDWQKVVFSDESRWAGQKPAGKTVADEVRSLMKEMPCKLHYDWSRPINAESGRGNRLGRSGNKRPGTTTTCG